VPCSSKPRTIRGALSVSRAFDPVRLLLTLRSEVTVHLGDYAVAAAALIAFATSIALWFGGQHDEGLFVAVWVPSILTFAAFVKLALRRRA
jgi:hypothetical protein